MNRRNSMTTALTKRSALPPPEPAMRVRRKAAGRRVGANLPVETYVAFKAHVARHGITGEQAIVAAIQLLLRNE